MHKILHILLLFLFFSLPLVHSHFLSTSGINFFPSVSGNYEFTKSQYFIFLSSLISFLFGLQLLKTRKKIIFPKVILGFILVFSFSTIFSLSSYTAFFGLDTKGHGSLLFLLLCAIYLVLLQEKKDFMKQLFYASILGVFFTSCIALKEYFLPSFDYGDLHDRALGTFGHPNYLALSLLLSVPFLIKKVRKVKILSILLILVFLTLIFTKSVVGVSILFLYTAYISIQGKHIPKRYYFVLISLGIISMSYVIFQLGFYTKLHSFVSRIYIWESVSHIIINNPKILFFGSGADTLIHYFDIYKSAELYIFENAGFNADRPHNIFLNIVFHFGIFGLGIMGYLLYVFFKNYKNNYISHTIIIFLLFTFLNFASMASYLVIVLLISCKSSRKEKRKFSYIFSSALLLLGTIGLCSSISYYMSEVHAKHGNYEVAAKIFPYNFRNHESLGDLKNIEKYAGDKTNRYFTSQILSGKEIQQVCEIYTQKKKSAENYFYCGNLAWDIGKEEIAKNFYSKGLAEIPDLWDNSSSYHTHFLIKNFVDGERFFSNKYWNLEEILERMGIENNFK